MAVPGKAIGASVPAAAVKVQRVLKRVGAVRPADMMQSGFDFDFDIFHFLGIVISVYKRRGVRGR
jgi:hypothetical protein